MTREEAIHKMEFSINAYQKLIDDSVQEGDFISGDVKGTWKTDSPSIIDAYEDMIEACNMAIKALEQESYKVSEYDKDHIWYKGRQYISLRRFLEVKKALEQEPCEDAIRRADAEALFRNARSKLNPSDYKTADEFNTRDLMLLNAEQFIHLLPPVRPQEPKTGHWIEIAQYSDGKHKIECSECGNHIFDRGHANSFNVNNKYKYCPNCGAKMVEPQERSE